MIKIGYMIDVMWLTIVLVIEKRPIRWRCSTRVCEMEVHQQLNRVDG